MHSVVHYEKHKLSVSFSIVGNLDDYELPEKAKLRRGDELWKQTCFELFLAKSTGSDYYELNFSPSFVWNFYYLSEYRAEPSEVEIEKEPKIESCKNSESYKISFEIELKTFDFDSYNVAAILLPKQGERTFWSVHHYNHVPDFHNRENFLKVK